MRAAKGIVSVMLSVLVTVFAGVYDQLDVCECSSDSCLCCSCYACEDSHVCACDYSEPFVHYYDQFSNSYKHEKNVKNSGHSIDQSYIDLRISYVSSLVSLVSVPSLGSIKERLSVVQIWLC